MENTEGFRVSSEVKDAFRNYPYPINIHLGTDRDNPQENILQTPLNKGGFFKTHLECYRIHKCIGKGSFGKVHLGEQTLTKKIVAIKAIDKSTFMHDERSRRKIQNEIHLHTLSTGSLRVIRL